jgi:hypothetical protein
MHLGISDKKLLSDDLQKTLSETNPNEFVIFEYGQSKCPTYYKNGIFRIFETAIALILLLSGIQMTAS